MLQTLIVLCGLLPSFLAVDSIEKTDKNPIKTDRYYPLYEGNKWQYDLLSNGNQVPVTNAIQKEEKIDGAKMFLLTSKVNGNVVATEHLSHTPKGLYRHRYNGMSFEKPVLLLKTPVVLGEKWKTSTRMGEEEFVVQCKLHDKRSKVKVPAGEFETLQLLVTTEDKGKPVETTYYFAADFGIVKQDFKMNGLEFSIELVHFSPGTPEPPKPIEPKRKEE